MSRRVVAGFCGFVAALVLLSSGLIPVQADCVCHGFWPNRKVTSSPVDSEYCMAACDVNRAISVDQCNTTA